VVAQPGNAHKPEWHDGIGIHDALLPVQGF